MTQIRKKVFRIIQIGQKTHFIIVASAAVCLEVIATLEVKTTVVILCE